MIIFLRTTIPANNAPGGTKKKGAGRVSRCLSRLPIRFLCAWIDASTAAVRMPREAFEGHLADRALLGHDATAGTGMFFPKDLLPDDRVIYTKLSVPTNTDCPEPKILLATTEMTDSSSWPVQHATRHAAQYSH
jgi:hypothetical protein